MFVSVTRGAQTRKKPHPRKERSATPQAPRADRPYMPEYGIAPASGGLGLLPWSWAGGQLSAARKYWLATSRESGAPHAMPVRGVWIEDISYFSTGGRSRKARNLAAEPRCVLCPELRDATLVLEGTATKQNPRRLPRAVFKSYAAKYPPWKLDPALGPIFALRPKLVIGFQGEVRQAGRPLYQDRYALALGWNLRGTPVAHPKICGLLSWARRI
jgi:hypothetical protein